MSGHAPSPCELDQMSKTKLVNMKMFLEQERFFLHLLKIVIYICGIKQLVPMW